MSKPEDFEEFLSDRLIADSDPALAELWDNEDDEIYDNLQWAKHDEEQGC